MMYNIVIIWDDELPEVVKIEGIDNAIQAVKEMRKHLPKIKTIPLFDYPKGCFDEK